MKRHVLLIVFLALAFSACAKKRVVTQPEVPQLAPPPPPERVVVPTPDNEPAPPPPAKTPEKKGQEGQKSVVRPPVEAPKPVEPPPQPPSAQPEQKPQQLVTADTAAQKGEAQLLISQAKKDKDKVDPKALNRGAREQFNTAIRFIDQADAALTEGNTGLALRLAKNAVTILTALANR